jgi:hypothetical protein
MNGNGVSWVAFPAIRMTDGKQVGHIVVMNRKTSRKVRLIPTNPTAPSKWWLSTPDCERDYDGKFWFPNGGDEALIPEIVESWGMKPLAKKDAIKLNSNFNPRSFANIEVTSEEMLEASQGFVKKVVVNWPIFKDGRVTYEEISLESEIFVTRSEADTNWWDSKWKHLTKVVSLNRPKAEGLVASEDEILDAIM